MSYLWVIFFLISFVASLFHFINGQTDIFQLMITNLFDTTKTAFEVSLNMTGMLTFWCGLLMLAEKSGLIETLAKMTSPVFRFLFPDVPKNHPAFAAIIMNMSANMLGLDNAATPFGLKAMQELQNLNPEPEKATRAQIMFLGINTASVTLFPLSVFAVLTELNYANPGELLIPILLTSLVGTGAAIITSFLLTSTNNLRLTLIFALSFIAFFFSLYLASSTLLHFFFPDKPLSELFSLVGNFSILLLITFITLLALIKLKDDTYAVFIAGAKNGFETAIRIIPYMVAILASISLLRTSGILTFIGAGIHFFLSLFLSDTPGLKAVGEVIPLGLMKSFSGSGSRGLMVELIKTHGVDSLIAKMAALLQGSSETTLYVLSVYFGSVGIKKSGKALFIGLFTDFVTVIAAITICLMIF